MKQFSIERVFTMTTLMISVCTMSAMMSIFMFMSEMVGRDMNTINPVAWVYAAFGTFMILYSIFHLMRARKIITKDTKTYIDTAVKEAVAAATQDLQVSDRLEAKVDEVVTDRIEKSDVVRLEEVQAPTILKGQPTS